jgi:hypothetical protein
MSTQKPNLSGAAPDAVQHDGDIEHDEKAFLDYLKEGQTPTPEESDSCQRFRMRGYKEVEARKVRKTGVESGRRKSNCTFWTWWARSNRQGLFCLKGNFTPITGTLNGNLR